MGANLVKHRGRKEKPGGWITANVVLRKGDDPYAIKRVLADLRILGYKRLVLKTDQENSIKHFD